MENKKPRDFGFARVGLAVPKLKVADPAFNSGQILLLIEKAKKEDVDVLLFPELCLTSYTAGDLFHQQVLLEKSLKVLQEIIGKSNDRMIVVLGMPLAWDNQIFNCAVVFQGKKILGVVPKTYIPGYKEFYEKRWFASARSAISKEIVLLGRRVPFGNDMIFQAANFQKLAIGVEICEDLWPPIPQSSYQAIAGATLLLNLSASNELVGKADYRRMLVQQQSARCIAAYAYCGAGVGESTTDVVFGGHGIIAENGEILKESVRFCRESQLVIRDIDFSRLLFYRQQTTSFGDSVFELNRHFRKISFKLGPEKSYLLQREISPHPFVPQGASQKDKRCEEIFSIQVAGLAKKIEESRVKKVLIGVSGGLDSALALLVAVKTFETLGLNRKDISAVTMPGFGTSQRTKENAIKLCKALGVSLQEIDIKNGCLQMYQDIGHDVNIQDTVFENVQARCRTNLLFAIGNKVKGLVLGTGNLSEIALGYCTFGGDHLSHYNVNGSVPKTLIRYLIRWVAETQFNAEARLTLEDILDTPVSAELIPAKDGVISQKTEEIIGPYELQDFNLYYLVKWGMTPQKILFLAQLAFKGKYSAQELKQWLILFIGRFFANQWKRSCMPDGPKVGSVSLSPRGDWRMPSDAEVAAWLEEIEKEDNNG
ncbi:MAG: NAD(+) synthase [Candidatus Nealsonbacteria bacterium]|nr:NAD(+) synthase [Candidatus Nealsonbacteria bacterium]